jgi:hypothetical protein
MQRLIGKILLLVMVVAVVSSPFIWLNKSVFNRMLRGSELKLAPQITTLIVGDSHGEKSLDPELIPGAANISLSGESLFYTYYKLKCFLQQNPKSIRRVILACSYHTLAKKYAEESVYDKVKSSFLIGRYYHYLDDEGKNRFAGSRYLLFYTLKYDYGLPLMEYTQLDTPNLKLLFDKHSERSKPSGYGGFSPLTTSRLDADKIKSKITEHFLDSHGQYTGQSQLMTEYLDKIAALCSSNGIVLYLYNAPLHREYRKLVPLQAVRKYDTVSSDLQRRYPDIISLDLTEVPLENSSFEDGDHLNKAGSLIVSKMLTQLLAEDDVNKKHPFNDVPGGN